MQNLTNCLERKIDKPGFGNLEYLGKTAERNSKRNWQQMKVTIYGDKKYRFLKVHSQLLLSADENITVMLEIICMKADMATAQLCMALKIWQRLKIWEGSKLICELRLKDFLFTAFVITLEKMSSRIFKTV